MIDVMHVETSGAFDHDATSAQAALARTSASS
jgi:hypothetical protein